MVKVESKIAILVSTIIIAGFLIFNGITYLVGTHDDELFRIRPVSGSLNYSSNSMPMKGNISFVLTITTPNNPPLESITVDIRDRQNQHVDNVTVTWIFNSSDNAHIKSGDSLTIEKLNTDLRGYEVLISIQGYRGVISGDVPETRLRGK